MKKNQNKIDNKFKKIGFIFMVIIVLILNINRLHKMVFCDKIYEYDI